ncbi:hypothetical protein BGZ83_002065 [Gryganskiella cystojenkinii]|nr:hypothetical protein BGZ83_002065 [Gryganskiella cystojenkinii]
MTQNISPPPFSPTAYLRRSQTTIARDSLISFSPPKSRRKNTPAMIPTIVIPDQCDEISSTAQSATTVSCSEDSLNSASSSTTMITDDGQQGSPTFSLRSVAPRTFQRLVPVQQGERLLLKVPENDGKSPTRHTMTAPPTSLAAAAMAAAQRAHSPSLTFGSPGDLNRSESSGSAKSMTRPLTGDDYIGQFERERASSRRVGFGSVMASSSSTLASSSYLRHDPLSDMATAPAAKAGSLSASFYGSNRSMISTGHDSQDHLYDLKSEQDFQDDKDRDQRRSFFSKMFSFYSGSGAESSSQSAQAARALAAHHHLRERQDSNNSDISEKLMHLPEPSPFEGMCSCRGVVNITSMTLILCGLILLILGYPIAASIKKERLAAEAEAAAAAAAVADSATGSSSRLSSSSIVGAGVKFTSPESAAMGTPNATVANVSPNGTDVLNTTTTTTTKPADTTNGQRRVIQVKFAMMDKNKHATGFLFNKDFYNKTV